MHASSAWMLFCRAPRQIEIVHSRNAPVVPSAPIEPPSAAMRNAGFASATTTPSHHVIALRSCLSSTWAVATASPPPPPVPAGGHTVNKLAHPRGPAVCTTCREAASTAGSSGSRPCLRGVRDAAAFRAGHRGPGTLVRERTGMPDLRDRGEVQAPPRAARRRVRRVVLATLAAPIDVRAEDMAISSSLEAGAPLIVANLLELPPYPA